MSKGDEEMVYVYEIKNQAWDPIFHISRSVGFPDMVTNRLMPRRQLEAQGFKPCVVCYPPPTPTP